MRTKLSLSVAALGLLSSMAGHAATADADAEHIKAVLTSRFPEVKIDAVVPTPMPGIYEVDTATDIVYSDATGEHVISGTMLETKSKQNLTALRWDEINSIDFSRLPLDLAIRNVKGDGSRVLAVFSDPHCPYCQKLEQELETLDNTTVYTFLFPIEALHKGATASAHQLWCSANKSEAWKQWMLTQQPAVAKEGCSEDPVQKIIALGNELRVQSTPTVFLANGQRVSGALPAKELEQRITAAEKARAELPKTASALVP